MQKAWYRKVYGAENSKRLSGPARREWKHLRALVLRRDNYTCRRCRRKLPSKDLSAHHLVPRDDGGANTTSNLVALCVPCHDRVEVEGIRTKREIEFDGDAHITAAPYALELLTEEEATPGPGDWRRWVYGGEPAPY